MNKLQNKRISVIIPMYNAEQVIVKALDSVRHQTIASAAFEIIVVNDGSVDGSREKVAEYRTQHPLLNIQLISQENGGVSKARNSALKIASGDFIALLDADDEWYPEKTERQLNIMESDKIDFLSCRRENHRIHFPYFINAQNLALVTFRKLMFRNEVQPSTVIFKRKILEDTGFFDENQRYGEDVNYWLKVSWRHSIYILNEVLVLAGSGKRTFGSSGLSANLYEMQKGFQKNLREMRFYKKINIFEYVLYYIFYKLKYLLIISRNLLLNLKKQ